MPAVLRIALPVPLPRLFDYLPPEGANIAPGTRVQVPFGRGVQVGIVMETAAQSSVPTAQLKRVQRVLDDEPLLHGELLSSLHWATDYWLGAPGDVLLNNALPTALRQAKPWPALGEERWRLLDAGRAAQQEGKRRGRSRALLDLLAEGDLRASELDLRLPGWRDAARRLHKAGLIDSEIALDDAPTAPTQAAPELNAGQRDAVEAVAATLGSFAPFLLHGITGSGKTEVYIQLMERTLAAGRQCLLLVPEIGLAPQTVARLRARLGVPVDVLHSNLAEGARARAWLRARNGQARVILGTRSAVFAPLPDAGLIVVDEEHDTSYKQQEGFRYHARDLAVVRAQRLGVPIVLGSATPSLETLANVEAERYRRLDLRERTGAHRTPPRAELVDVRGQAMQHGLSNPLLAALDACVERGEQALIFRNRRGYAPLLMCHLCGWHAECPRCEKPLALHQGRQRLVCHHCELERPVPTVCPGCGGEGLHRQGHGTERLEEALQTRYVDTPVLRIDRETTRRRDAFEDLMGPLADGRPAILVGTQMLAKGHDLPNLTLVAITSLDEGLHSLDFRAHERLSQLIVQVAGRAGRAGKPGRVLLQTHQPEHPLLQTLLHRGYSATCAQMLDERRALRLPPFAYQALLRADATRREHVDAFLDAARDALPASETLRWSGPMPAPMPLRAGRHRGQLLLEADTRSALHAALKSWRDALGELEGARRVRWSIDVDPVDLY
ncbi:primosomal protein N' [Oleiagrimonas soli]|uniref:Replication restart protein PriA n=1 Tax=Oleiagrimonas soli TaxID=1543381 RepID=A0A099CZ65_9GAMM|nr:primosomal protein N' [Oleiagrimonas soli]KGI78902.1 primosome assembly protein PriA [Oleiagrimonas soli]MBB6184408.1 primosomal protein N' (replication factor Y) [Oleiagrimonas soli]